MRCELVCAGVYDGLCVVSSYFVVCRWFSLIGLGSASFPLAWTAFSHLHFHPSSGHTLTFRPTVCVCVCVCVYRCLSSVILPVCVLLCLCIWQIVWKCEWVLISSILPPWNWHLTVIVKRQRCGPSHALIGRGYCTHTLRPVTLPAQIRRQNKSS